MSDGTQGKPPTLADARSRLLDLGCPELAAALGRLQRELPGLPGPIGGGGGGPTEPESAFPYGVAMWDTGGEFLDLEPVTPSVLDCYWIDRRTDESWLERGPGALAFAVSKLRGMYPAQAGGEGA